MSNYASKKDEKILREYTKSTVVDRDVLDRGSLELDRAAFAAKKAGDLLERQTELKAQLNALLKRCAAQGFDSASRAQMMQIKTELKNLEHLSYQNHEVETQEVVSSFDELTASNEEFARRYNIDLSNPYMASFSNIERAVITDELVTKFDLLRLDKYDYAFASGVGVMCGFIDALLVGTAASEGGSALGRVSDDAFNKMVRSYAKMRGWPGGREGGDSFASAKRWLEKNAEVGYDQKLSDETAGLVARLTPSNHHLRNIDHSFGPLGMLTAIIDMMQGKATFFDSASGKIVRLSTGAESKNIIEATVRWFDHQMSDIAGSSVSKGRGSGLPGTMQTTLQGLSFGEIPVGKDSSFTVGELVTKMYENGYDVRFAAATAVPVILSEVLMRLYWFFKSHFYYGKSVQDSLPFGKSRELQRLLLITALTFSAVDVGHATIKGVSSGNLITFFNSLNYMELFNLGYKLIVNFKLEHEHNQKVRELMQTEIRDTYQRLSTSAPFEL